MGRSAISQATEIAGVETVYPLRFKGEFAQPFPTIYWLHDRCLQKKLGEIERLNGVVRAEQWLIDDAARSEAYLSDHRFYAQTRWALLTPEHRNLVRQTASLRAVFDSGIAGIAKLNTVKCLHAQFAFHLVRREQGGTVIGRWIEQQAGFKSQ
jgi:hypothetical protein